MPRDHFVRIAHRRQVVSLVPLDQQLQVSEQLLFLGVAQGDTEFGGTAGQFVGVRRGDDTHQALCSSWRPLLRFFRWIISSDTAAGVTPGMREAWPSVDGLAWDSLCWISLERPAIAE